MISKPNCSSLKLNIAADPDTNWSLWVLCWIAEMPITRLDSDAFPALLGAGLAKNCA